MADEKKPPESEKNSSDFLDVVTGKIGKITVLLTTVVSLLAGVNQVFQVGPDLFSKFKLPVPVNPQPIEPVIPVVPKPPALGDCFKPKMIVDPEMVSISKWDSMMLQLTGRNDCQETLGVHVAFRGNSDRVRIMSPFAECVVLNDPTCWQQASIDSGDLHKEITRPHLIILSKPLGDPVKLTINWNVYNMQTKGLLRADTVQITLRDDP